MATDATKERLADKTRAQLPDVRAIAACRIDEGEFSQQVSTLWAGRTDICLTAQDFSSYWYHNFSPLPYSDVQCILMSDVVYWIK
ncbi:hypothetical protein QQX98_005061 [Neonectria punicea]|uniref:Uncharacterized protein n=1 Tax=Neonectria punicea TaxID=979145 RepID=A0ABR1H6S4_9HYPO